MNLWLKKRGIDATCFISLADTGATQFACCPLTAVIAPTDRSDEGHALGDQAGWSFFNAQRIRALAAGSALKANQWDSLRTLTREPPRRLYREMPEGHFFFVGESGAKATVEQMHQLIFEAHRLHNEIGFHSRAGPKQ
ncbi:hypothetical protein [Bradyrhizobium genosp. P]|uniref:hypothetical protein n=1 Tax=Bradyrhizobium genosp. P TaxID=83641 RepID=UPI003CE97420